MIRHVLTFLVAASVGALVVLAIRSALHRPYGEAPAPAPGQPQPTPAPTAPAPDPHAGHTAVKPVNDLCAICGMDVDPTLTTTYRGMTIAFGCAKCPAKFHADPERYGPHFLTNKKAP